MTRHPGFTIIEVLLFLSISALLFMVALVSLNAAIDSTRFRDATTSLENFLSQQYNEVRSGVSYRVDDSEQCSASQPAEKPGAANDCIVIGRLLALESSGEFDGVDTISVYPIISSRCPRVSQPEEAGCPSVASAGSCAPLDGSSAARLASYCPRAITSGYSQHYQLEWGIHLPRQVAGNDNPRVQRGSATASFNRIAIIHSPTSENLYTYIYSSTNELNADLEPIEAQYMTQDTVDDPVLMCLKSPDWFGDFHYLQLGYSQGADFLSTGDAAGLPAGGMRCS